MNTRRHTHRYLLAFGALFVADFIALILSDSCFESCLLFILFTINLYILVRYTS